MSILFYRMFDDVIAPERATENSAAVDLRAFLPQDRGLIRSYDPNNKVIELSVRYREEDDNRSFYLPPFFRALVPTGLKLNITPGYYADLRIRSSKGFKDGIGLATGASVIDSDYVDELFIPLFNFSDRPMKIQNAERVAQMIMTKIPEGDIVETTVEPVRTTRDGGFGSTGND